MGWFKKDSAEEEPEKVVNEERSITPQESTTDTIIDVKLPEEEANPPAVSFFAMFKFTTKLEITLNIIALCAAAGAGATQPLMSLIFGNLTQSFVAFGSAVQSEFKNPTQSGAEALNLAAASFRKQAAHDALILVGIGKSFLHDTLCHSLSKPT